MTTFLFWNLNNNSLVDIITKLVSHHTVDILMLAESPTPPEELLSVLSIEKQKFQHIPGECTKIHIFTRFTEETLKPILETDRLTIRHLVLPEQTDILLAVAHFSSKLYQSDDSQSLQSTRYASSIQKAEMEVGHSKTVLVGDLNMNPFETGVISAGGLHAVMSQDIAKKGSRVVQQEKYPFFYNPMWSLFGDLTPGPPGTYYYDGSEHKTYFWNMFDQVLIRPELLDKFRPETLKILETSGEISFLSANGIPNDKLISDHLPLLFEVDL